MTAKVKVGSMTVRVKVTEDNPEPNLTPEQMREELTRLCHDPMLYEAVKKVFDRSFTLGVDESDKGRPVLRFRESDSGNAVMTITDVAIFLQTDRASVRRMTRERSQRQSRHPMPFVKIGAKMIRFNRPDIEAWWRKCCENGNGVLALPPKGKIKKMK
jgi:predicted DNA-binding transcriptional regulator AlpA